MGVCRVGVGMRVLVISQHFAPDDNAPAYRWGWLVSHLAELGWDVDVVSATWRKDLPDVVVPSRVKVYRVKNILAGMGLGRRFLNELVIAWRSIWVALGTPRPDVVVVTAPPIGAMLVADVIARCRRRPLVLDLRDAWPELLDHWPSWSEDGASNRKQPLREAVLSMVVPVLRRILYRVRSRAALVVTTSQRLAEAIPEALMVRNIPRDTTRLIPKPWDGCLHVLYAGTVGRAQLLATAVRAAAEVQRRGGHMRLRIVGHGAHLEAIRSLAKELKAPVEILPRVSPEQMQHHYQWADSLLVMLRHWQPLEATVPSKLYDCLALGRHISSSVAGESAAIIEETQAGSVTPPEDVEALATSWLNLIDDPARLHVGEAGMRWITEHCDADHLSRRYHQALTQVAQR